MKITVDACLKMQSAIARLEATGKIKLAAGARLALSLNAARLEQIRAAHQKARDAIIYAICDGANSTEDPLLSGMIEREDVQLRAMEIDIPIEQIAIADIDIDGNQLSALAVAPLFPLFKDAPQEPVAISFPEYKLPADFKRKNGAGEPKPTNH